MSVSTDSTSSIEIVNSLPNLFALSLAKSKSMAASDFEFLKSVLYFAEQDKQL